MPSLPSYPILLGIDPGSIHCGWGVVQLAPRSQIKCLGYGVINMSTKTPLPARLANLYTKIGAVIERFKPEAGAIESIFHAENTHSALVLGHVRGVIMLAMEQAGITINEIAPTAVKKAAVGNGNASKEQVSEMISILLGLPPIKTKDASDALAIAVALAHRL